MTAVSIPSTHTPINAERVSFAALVRSEWIKITSLPIMIWALIGIAFSAVAGAVFAGATLAGSMPPSVLNLEITVGEVVAGAVILGQIIAGVFGVLIVGSEYSSGTIQPTLIASPDRLRVLWAKTVTAFVPVAVLGVASMFAAWAASYPFYAEFDLQAPLDAPGVAFALFGTGMYLGLCAVVGVGLATLVRSTTVGSIIIFVITLLAPVLSSVLPPGFVTQLLRISFLGNAGDAMSRAMQESGAFINVAAGHVSPGAGWMIATLWAVCALVAGAIALKRKDA